mgnify:CR=1 FL=1
MKNKYLKILLKNPQDRGLIDNFQILLFWTQVKGRELKYALYLDSILWKN